VEGKLILIPSVIVSYVDDRGFSSSLLITTSLPVDEASTRVSRAKAARLVAEWANEHGTQMQPVILEGEGYYLNVETRVETKL